MLNLKVRGHLIGRWACCGLCALAVSLAIPTIGQAQTYQDASSQEPAAQADPAQPAETAADPNTAGQAPAAGQPNLTWQKFPAEFADYYTTQRLLANPAEPQSFCKSQKPLRVEPQYSFQMQAILDESGGTGTGYDTLYIDSSGMGDFSEPQVYKLGQTDRKTGLEGHALVSYFDNVNILKDAAQGQTTNVQMYVEQNPDRIEGSEFLLNVIPAQWAVGTVQVNGQATPIAMVDGNWNDSVVNRGGARPWYVNQTAPGDDFGVVRGDYIILGKPGETALQPGDPNSWLGKSGSTRSLNTQYLVTDNGMFEIQADQGEQGVNFQLVPATDVQTSTIDLSYLPSTTGRVAMYGTNACVVLDNHGSYVQVPADTYYVPLFGAYTLEAPAAGRAVLTPPPGVDAANVRDFDPMADRDQKIYTAEPPGGELGTTDAIRWAQAQNRPFSFANRQAAGWATLEVSVIAQDTNYSLASAALTVQSFSQTGWGRAAMRRIASDKNGRCSIEVPGDAQGLYATCQVPGYVPTTMYWTNQGNRPIPSQYTWVLEKGTTIGGAVRDERGRPVAGARVTLFASASGGRGGEPTPALQQLQLQTDKRGKWKCDAAPAKLSQVLIALTHPQYISDNYPSRSVPVEELRNQTSELVMKQGIMLTGKVTGPKNKPMAEATIHYGNFTPGKTDKKGQYRVRNLLPGRLIVTVRAPGCAPEQQTIKIEENMRPVDFELAPGNRINGRVIDQWGHGVATAQVYLQSWRGTRALMWQTKTDAQGRWSWTEAPADEAVFSIKAEGFMPIDKIRIGPDRLEQTITVRSSLQVSGRVTDAATGQPIPSFTVTPGVTWNVPGIYRWLTAIPCTNGTFGVELREPSSLYRLRVEAPGYLPTMSKSFAGNDGDQVLEVALPRDE